MINQFDKTIVCTYYELNKLLPEDKQVLMQFELCEKPIIKVADKFKASSVVIMDGPFTCIDPFGDSSYHVQGDVRHAIHKTSFDFSFNAGQYKKFLNQASTYSSPSKKHDFEKSFRKYLDPNGIYAYQKSMYTVRAVMPGVDETDERPSFFKEISDKVIYIFSGKVVSSVAVAKDVAKTLSNG
jgi:hypothetical protein